MVGTLRKLVWAFEFWNEMLVSNIRCKNLSKKAWVSELFYSNFEKRGGEKLMTCHLFLDNFFVKFHDLLGCFQRLRVLKQILFQENSSILTLISWNVRLFWIIVFRKRHFIAESWLCFRACNSRIVTCDQEFCRVVWFLCFNHFVTESFEKFP